MSTITLQQAPHQNTLRGYLQNVSGAARTFLAALIAFEFAPTAVSKADEKAEVSADAQPRGQVSMLSLYRLASQTDSVRPDLVDEIRLLAAREAMRHRRS